MPHRIKYDNKRRLILCRLEGQIEGEEVVAIIDEATRLVAGGQRGRCNVCWDCRLIRSLAVSPSELGEIVTQMNRFAAEHPHGRTAIVTARLMDQVMAQLLVLKSYSSTRDRKSFTVMNEALEWVAPGEKAMP